MQIIKNIIGKNIILYCLIFIYCEFLIVFALFNQYMFNVLPCNLCWWQRYAIIYISIMCILTIVFFKRYKGLSHKNIFVYLSLGGSITLICVSTYHTGTQYNLWNTSCSANTSMEDLTSLTLTIAPPCNVINWKLFGITAPIYNIISGILISIAISFNILISYKNNNKNN